MNERQKQTRFLTSLMRFGDNEACRALLERLHRAQAEEKLVRRKMFNLMVVAGLSALGLGYTGVFNPVEFQRTGSILIKLFCISGLAALLSLAVCGCWWCWHRMMVNGLQDEGRHLVHSLLKAQLVRLDQSEPTQTVDTTHIKILPLTVSATNEVRVEDAESRLAA